MTTNSTLITAAFREANYIGQGQTPTTEEQTEALRLLQSMVDSLQGSVIGIKYKPWYVPFPFHTAPKTIKNPAIYSGEVNAHTDRDQQYPPIQSRAIMRNTQPHTLYLQYQPLDGATFSIVDAGFTGVVTLDANGMFFETDANDTTVTIEPRAEGRNPTREYVFREDTASWNQVNNLVLEGEMPYPTQFDDYWITGLALRLASSFGAKQVEVTMVRFREMSSFLKGWYRQHQEVLIGTAGTPTEQSYNTSYYGNDQSRGGY